MSSSNNPEDEFADGEDLFQSDQVPEREPSPLVSERRPDAWHKPRKQWIRCEQWGRLTGRLLDELSLDGRPFRYLTLPGRYLLDVRHLHGVCEQRGVRLKFLGFDSSRKDDPEITISMDEVWRLPFIDKASVLQPDRFEELPGKTVASRSLSQFGHFDIINLDLCDSVASREAGASGSSLDAIKSLVEWQSNHRKEPWYLFLTTRADRAAVKPSVMRTLLHVVRENLQRNSGFQRAVVESQLFDEQSVANEMQYLEAPTSESATEGVAALLDDPFQKVFGIGFSKWLLGLSLCAWKVKLEINACYRVGDDTQIPNMLSLAFKFESLPDVITDPTGLAPASRNVRQSKSKLIEEGQIAETSHEHTLAISYLDRFSKLIDVDELLHSNNELRERFVISNADLMAQARFDREQIVEWGRTSCWRPQ